MHGYYDQSPIGSDQFAQVLQFDSEKGLVLQPEIAAKGIHLAINERPSISYWVFNQADPVVGGNSRRAAGLRRAISQAFDWEEFIAIFLNGRGVLASGPIPPGIEGHLPYQKPNKPYRERLNDAKTQLAEAGYPGGINPETQQPLMLHFLTSGSGAPEEQTRLGWIREQFSKLGIVLNIEVLPFARFLDRLHRGEEQMAMTGWLADYPDPENFLFLFISKQKALAGGQNLANYQNPSFDQCYEAVRTMPHGPSRVAEVQRCSMILQQDGPVMFGLFPTTYVLSHSWVKDYEPNGMSLNLLKYSKREPDVRQAAQTAWNQPKWWVLWSICAGVGLIVTAVVLFVRQRQRRSTIFRVSKDD
jgi:oligopeptide transport system substrate-binding protein